MFDDINAVSKVELTQVKASPSVNSPNDGGFNSEENVRWANKKLTTKPFIYGKTEQEVSDSFGNSVAMGWYGAYNANDAMFSIDGYLFKVAANNVSYDVDSSGVDINLMPAQKFISGLANVGTDYELSTKYNDFLFDEYNPDKHVDLDVVTEAMETALAEGTVIGFIKNSYIGSYLEQLTVSVSNVSYRSTTISIDNSIDLSDFPNSLKEISEDVLREVPVATTPNNPTLGDYVNIYYPVRLKKVKVFNGTNADPKYTEDIRMYFTDIFGVEFIFGSIYSNTHDYPFTFNQFSNMDDNAPLNAVNFTGCKKTTMPTHQYNIPALYNQSNQTWERKPKTDDGDHSSDITGFSTAIGTDLISSVFDIKTVSNLLGYLPTTVPEDVIPGITNTLSYYCMKFDSDYSQFCLRVTTGTGDKTVPVSFMTSNGVIAPDGFVTSNGISRKYPVEGYMHFIKRLYVLKENPAYNFDSPTEEEIDAVTVQDLTSWTDFADVKTNGTVAGTTSIQTSFSVFYHNFLYPCICLYLSLGYFSLLDNAVYSTDDQKMKACGCGFALSQSAAPSITNQDISVDQDYKYTSYVNNGGQLQAVSDTSVVLDYHKDYMSDYDRVHLNTRGTDATQLLGNYYYRDSFSWGDTLHVPHYFEDPINLIRRCMASSEYTGAKTTTDPSTITVFYFVDGNGLDKKTFDTRRQIAVDGFLFPKVVYGSDQVPSETSKAKFSDYFVGTLSTHLGLMYYMDSDSHYSYTFGNGLNYNFQIYTWFGTLPYIAKLQKDSLNYLSGKDYTDGKYNGVQFGFATSSDYVTDDELHIFNTWQTIIPRVQSYDFESFNGKVDFSDADVKTAREAFLHISKVYDGDRELGMILDDIRSDVDYIKNEIGEQVEDITGRVEALETTVYTETTGLVDKVGSLDDTVYDPDDGLVAVVGRCRKLIYSGELRSMNSGEHIYYRVYGFSEADTNKLCEIFTTPGDRAGIGAYSSPFDPQSVESDLCPLINMGINTVTVLPGIMAIQAYVFSFDFETLNLPYTLSSLWPYACSGSSSTLTGPLYVNFQNGVRLLNGYCFRYSRVKNIYIPNTVVGGLSIPDVNRALGAAQSAFVDCTNMSAITFDCHDVGTTVCENCIALYDVSMTANVKHIYPYPFVGCASYLTINYLGSKDEFLAIHKDQHWDSLDVLDTRHIQTICCSDYYASYDPDTDNYAWSSYPVE